LIDKSKVPCLVCAYGYEADLGLLATGDISHKPAGRMPVSSHCWSLLPIRHYQINYFMHWICV